MGRALIEFDPLFLQAATSTSSNDIEQQVASSKSQPCCQVLLLIHRVTQRKPSDWLTFSCTGQCKQWGAQPATLRCRSSSAAGKTRYRLSALHITSGSAHSNCHIHMPKQCQGRLRKGKLCSHEMWKRQQSFWTEHIVRSCTY